MSYHHHPMSVFEYESYNFCDKLESYRNSWTSKKKLFVEEFLLFFILKKWFIVINKDMVILTPVPYIFIIYNSTNYCTILILLLHIITYDLLLHVSMLIRHLQGALCAWLKLHLLLILIKWNS